MQDLNTLSWRRGYITNYIINGLLLFPIAIYKGKSPLIYIPKQTNWNERMADEFILVYSGDGSGDNFWIFLPKLFNIPLTEYLWLLLRQPWATKWEEYGKTPTAASIQFVCRPPIPSRYRSPSGFHHHRIPRWWWYNDNGFSTSKIKK